MPVDSWIHLLRERSRFWVPALLLCLIWGMLLFWQLGTPNSLLSEMENQSYDWRIRNTATATLHPDLVFVAFDRTAEELLFPEDIIGNPPIEMMTQQWPWSRELWAMTFERLIQAGAKVVALDITLEGSNPEQDVHLKTVIDQYPNRVVLGIREETSLSRGRVAATLAPLSPTLVPDWDKEVFATDGRLGLVNIVPDADQVVRHYGYTGKGFFLPQVDAFATKILRKSGGTDALSTLPDRAMIRYAPPPPGNYTPIMLWDLFLEDSWQSTFQNGEFFRDKLVVIGPYGTGFKDVYQTPVAKDPPMAGPQIHLNALAAALNHDFLYPSSRIGYLVSLALSLILPILLFLLLPNRTWGYPIWLAGAILLPVASFYILEHYDILIPLLFPLLGWSGCWLILLSLETIRSWMEKKRIRSTLDRYLSKDVAATLISSKTGYYQALGGVRREAAVLFSDLRGFTTLSEQADPAELVTQLNQYLTGMVNEIFKQQGRLDKFMGDAVMAVWGDLYTHLSARENCIHAVLTAQNMIRRLHELNRLWEAQGRPRLGMGIGIHFGELVFGNLGSDQRMELTVIGDTVNLGSRLEGLTKNYPHTLLVSESVANFTRTDFDWQYVDKVQVKGRSQPLEIYTLATSPDDQPPSGAR